MISSSDAKAYTPELLTRMSTLPKLVMAEAMIFCASAVLETSPWTVTALPPALVMVAAVFSAPALSEA